MFDFSDYHVRQLDINQGYKPRDFGGIAINTHHPEHGYITLTTIRRSPIRFYQ
jgi:hypothetical protein